MGAMVMSLHRGCESAHTLVVVRRAAVKPSTRPFAVLRTRTVEPDGSDAAGISRRCRKSHGSAVLRSTGRGQQPLCRGTTAEQDQAATGRG